MDELTMQAPSSKSSSQTLKGFGSNPHEVQNPLLLKMVRPSSLPHKSQVKNESPNALFPPFGLLIPTLNDQWPRLDLAMSNQWVRSTQIISLRKPTFLSHFMSINSPTL